MNQEELYLKLAQTYKEARRSGYSDDDILGVFRGIIRSV